MCPFLLPLLTLALGTLWAEADPGAPPLAPPAGGPPIAAQPFDQPPIPAPDAPAYSDDYYDLRFSRVVDSSACTFTIWGMATVGPTAEGGTAIGQVWAVESWACVRVDGRWQWVEWEFGGEATKGFEQTSKGGYKRYSAGRVETYALGLFGPPGGMKFMVRTWLGSETATGDEIRNDDYTMWLDANRALAYELGSMSVTDTYTDEGDWGYVSDSSDSTSITFLGEPGDTCTRSNSNQVTYDGADRTNYLGSTVKTEEDWKRTDGQGNTIARFHLQRSTIAESGDATFEVRTHLDLVEWDDSQPVAENAWYQLYMERHWDVGAERAVMRQFYYTFINLFNETLVRTTDWDEQGRPQSFDSTYKRAGVGTVSLRLRWDLLGHLLGGPPEPPAPGKPGLVQFYQMVHDIENAQFMECLPDASLRAPGDDGYPFYPSIQAPFAFG